MSLPFPKSGACLTDAEIAGYLARAGDRERIEAHLAGCADCLDLLLAARRLAREEAPVRRPSYRFVRRRTNPFLSLAAAAAVLLVAVLAVVALTRKTDPAPAPVTRQAPPRVEPPREEKRPVEEKRETPREEKRDEKPVEKRDETPREKPSERGIADRIPGPKSGETAVVRKEAFTVKSVTGRVKYRNRELRAGDALELSVPLRVPFGEHAAIEVAGASILLHHETEVAIGPGALRIATGRAFVRGEIRVETPAGSLIPSGTEFAVEVAGAALSVVVRSGSVRIGTAKVEKGQFLKVAAGQTPGRPVRVDLAAALAWADAIDRASKPDEAWLLLYPAQKKSAIVVTAPHMPIETQTSRFAAGLAESLRTSLVVAHGYKRPRKIEVNEPGDSPAEREAYEEYRRLVREGGAVAPLAFLIEIHGYGSEGEMPEIQVATSGFSKAELEQVKLAFARLVRKHAPEVEATIVFDLTDPKEIKYPAGAMKTKGIFRPEITQRGWKMELPWAVRWTCREKYVAILAELVESMR